MDLFIGYNPPDQPTSSRERIVRQQPAVFLSEEHEPIGETRDRTWDDDVDLLHELPTRPAPSDLQNLSSRSMPSRVDRRYLFTDEEEEQHRQQRRRGSTRDRSWDTDMLIVD